MKHILLCNFALNWQMDYQDLATGSTEGMVFFHAYIFCFIVAISLLLNGKVMKLFQIFAHHSALEYIWTGIFAIILVIIAIPFFFLLYILKRLDLEDSLILRIVGNQWFWSYEYETTKIFENFGTVLTLVRGFLAIVQKRNNFTTLFVSNLNLIKRKLIYMYKKRSFTIFIGLLFVSLGINSVESVINCYFFLIIYLFSSILTWSYFCFHHFLQFNLDKYYFKRISSNLFFKICKDI